MTAIHPDFIATSPFQNTQRKLSKKQTTFIIGPLLASPAKMLVSAAQIIYGLAHAIFYGVLSIFSSKYNTKYDNGDHHWTHGLISLIYAATNMATLGIVGNVFENFIKKLHMESCHHSPTPIN